MMIIIDDDDDDDALQRQNLTLSFDRRHTRWCRAAMSACANSAQPSSFNTHQRVHILCARFAGLRV